MGIVYIPVCIVSNIKKNANQPRSKVFIGFRKGFI